MLITSCDILFRYSLIRVVTRSIAGMKWRYAVQRPGFPDCWVFQECSEFA